MASLTAVLKSTAKDWWMAERGNVHDWKQFKELFLQSFLSEDYEEVAIRKLMERRQGARESFRDFAFHYRALCLRWKKGMSEREVVQSILRNCNPRLASLLRGNIKDVGELVRVGTQIERDFGESKKYWSQVNVDEQKKKNFSAHEAHRKPATANTRVVQTCQRDIRNLIIPITLQDIHVAAMVDTGSTLSLIQKACWKQLSQQEVYLPGGGQTFLLANGQRQTAVGKVVWKSKVQGCPIELTLYIMNDADLTVPIILGMDFLLKSGMVLDFNNAQYSFPPVEDAEAPVTFPFLPQDIHSTINFYLAIPLQPCSDEVFQSICQLSEKADTDVQTQQELENLMLSWSTVCNQEIGHTNLVKHRIITTDELPFRKRAYKVSIEKQSFVEDQIRELLDKKIIRPSSSPWASPVVVVQKKDGGSRLCIDYHGLNAKTHRDAYPMPQIQDILESLHGATVFSTLDLKSGYWQLEMESESIQKTAFITSSGLYEFLRLPFGLKNAAASFQRLMEHVLRELKGKCCMVYIDDVVVFSKNKQDHLQHLQQVFQCFHKAGLTLNLKKCNFIQKSLTFLGHVVSSDGIKTDPTKVSAVSSFPIPQSLKDVQRFLGLAGWYHRFIPRFSEKAAPLHALKQKNSTWAWTDQCQQAFDLIKQDLIQSPVLASPDFSQPFRVQTDASEVGLGAVLTQESAGEEHVIAYASKTVITPRQMDHTTTRISFHCQIQKRTM